MSPVASGKRRQVHGWRLSAVLLAVLAAAFGVAGWVREGTQPAQDVKPPASTSTRVATTVASGSVRALRPIRLTIRSIGVHTAVVRLGQNADHTVEVPTNPDTAGWYRFGSIPGQPGSTVVLGHVDSEAGPAVFYQLKSLVIGAQIEVQRADGSTIRFEVDKIATYPNDKFPAQSVYRTSGRSTLTLVTCGGGYDATRGGYQANVVVSARPIRSARGAQSYE